MAPLSRKNEAQSTPNERGNAETEKGHLIKAFMIEFSIR